MWATITSGSANTSGTLSCKSITINGGATVMQPWSFRDENGKVILEDPTNEKTFSSGLISIYYKVSSDIQIPDNVMVYIGKDGVTITSGESVKVQVTDIFANKTIFTSGDNKTVTIPTSTFTNEKTHYLLQITDSNNEITSMQIIRNGSDILATAPKK